MLLDFSVFLFEVSVEVGRILPHEVALRAGVDDAYRDRRVYAIAMLCYARLQRGVGYKNFTYCKNMSPF